MIPWQRDEDDKFQTLGFIAYFSPTNFYQLQVGQELISVIASTPKYTYHILLAKDKSNHSRLTRTQLN